MSSGYSGLTEGNWESRLQFASDPDHSTTYTLLSHTELVRSVANHILGTTEKIKGMWIYTTPLAEWMPKTFGLQHEFVVIESKNYYWSFESNRKYISVQRSTEFNAVKQRFHGHDRGNSVSLKGSYSNKSSTGHTIRDVFNLICEERCLENQYRFLVGKSFASLLFENFSKNFNFQDLCQRLNLS